MSAEQLRSARWRTATRRLLTVVAVAALTVGLFWAYLLQSRTQSANADAAGQVLQGWEMLHGNLLLRGWYLSDVSFYTFEVPLDGLIGVIYGLRTDVVHVAAAIEYALLVLLAALLAAGAGRDRGRAAREAWVRGLLAAGVMVAPGAFPGAHVLLLAADHTGIGVPVLVTLLVVDRVRPRRLLPVIATALLVCVLLMWAQLDDPVAEFACALPLALACAAPLVAVPFRRLANSIRVRRGRPAATPLPWRREAALRGYDIALLVVAVASYGLTKLSVKAITSAGGFYLHPIPGGAQISNWDLLGRQLNVLGQNLMYLFGANFWGRPQPEQALSYLHLVGVAVAVLGLLIAIWSWPMADRITRTLVIAVLVVLAAGAVSPLTQPISGAHEVAIVLPLGAALAGRCIGPWLAGRRPAESQPADDQPADHQTADDQPADDQTADGQAAAQARPGRLTRAARVTAACVLAAVGAGYLSDLAYNAAQPSFPAVNADLADWLVAHNLTSGIGGYWDANITILASGGKVRIAPVTDAGAYGYPWESKAFWFDPHVSSANFVIAHLQQIGAGYEFANFAINRYGRPDQEYYFGKNTVVLVYDERNLLENVIQPVPQYLHGPPPGYLHGSIATYLDVPEA